MYLIQEALLASCGAWGKVGFSKAMSAGWIQIDKSGTVPEMNLFRLVGIGIGIGIFQVMEASPIAKMAIMEV